jgi:hypothetical protein
MGEAVRRISIETYVIAGIALLDLVLTIALVQGRQAQEGNPLMGFYLSHGLPAFVLAKGVFTAMPLIILEWGRRHRPQFVKAISRAAIAAYVGMYIVMFAQVNLPALVLQSQLPEDYYHQTVSGEAASGIHSGAL